MWCFWRGKTMENRTCADATDFTAFPEICGWNEHAASEHIKPAKNHLFRVRNTFGQVLQSQFGAAVSEICPPDFFRANLKFWKILKVPEMLNPGYTIVIFWSWLVIRRGLGLNTWPLSFPQLGDGIFSTFAKMCPCRLVCAWHMHCYHHQPVIVQETMQRLWLWMFFARGNCPKSSLWQRYCKYHVISFRRVYTSIVDCCDILCCWSDSWRLCHFLDCWLRSSRSRKA